MLSSALDGEQVQTSRWPKLRRCLVETWGSLILVLCPEKLSRAQREVKLNDVIHPAELDACQVLDTPETLAQRAAMDEERLRRLTRRQALVNVHPQRLHQLGAVRQVVLLERRNPLPLEGGESRETLAFNEAEAPSGLVEENGSGGNA